MCDNLMDVADVDDMLFGHDAPPGDQEYAMSDASDDDMLDDPDDDEEILWIIEDDAVLTPATDDSQGVERGDIEAASERDANDPSTTKSMRPVRDR